MANTIIRAHHRTRYLVIDQRTVDDGRLSWAARGMLAYLLSRPDTWQVRVTDLQRRGHLGRDGTYKLINELCSAGYMEFRRARDQRGRMRGGSYIVREIPNPPYPELPDADAPELAAPEPVAPEALSITEVKLKPNLPITYSTKARRTCVDERAGTVEFAEWIPDELRPTAAKKVARFDLELAQMLIDEWAGAYIEGRIKKSPIGYLSELATRLDRNQFRSFYAEDIAQARAATDADFSGSSGW